MKIDKKYRKRQYLQLLDPMINIMVKLTRFFPRRLHIFFYRLVFSHNNIIAMFIRYLSLKKLTKSCGKNVGVFSNVYIVGWDNLVIGDNVSIHPLSYIQATGNLEIGSNVSIAHSVSILTEEHLYKDKNKNIKDQGIKYSKTIIENDVWIGAGSRILSGVRIGEGSVVGAGSVVTKDVPKNSVVVGVPAKIIKER